MTKLWFSFSNTKEMLFQNAQILKISHILFQTLNYFLLIKVTDHCASTPCRAAGTCENFANGYICHCTMGVRGKNCERRLERDENLCGSSPCWNGGICFSNTTNWGCVCPNKQVGNCKDLLSIPNSAKKNNNNIFLIN